MDDRQFDALTRRIGDAALPLLPRRGVVALLGGAVVTGALGLFSSAQEPTAERQKKKRRKKKCRQDNRNCVRNKDCCSRTCDQSLNTCQPKQSVCPVSPRFDLQWGSFGTGDGQFETPWGIATN